MHEISYPEYLVARTIRKLGKLFSLLKWPVDTIPAEIANLELRQVEEGYGTAGYSLQSSNINSSIDKVVNADLENTEKPSNAEKLTRSEPRKLGNPL